MSSVLRADFVQPTGWTRPASIGASQAARTTYQEWQRFEAVEGPNAANDGISTDNAATGSHDGVFYANFFATQPGGNASNAFDSAFAASNSILTSDANIYSPSGAIKPRVTLSSQAGAVGYTQFVINARSVGMAIETETVNAVRLNGVSITTLPGYDYTETYNETLPSGPMFGGTRTDHLWVFQAPLAATYTLDFAWTPVSSSSLDAISVDTRSVVPEPTLLGTLAVAGLLMARRRRD